jgi:hypothetical protein
VHDIFNFRNGKSLTPTGYMPTFAESLIEKDLLKLEFLYGQAEKFVDDEDGPVEPTSGRVSRFL